MLSSRMLPAFLVGLALLAPASAQALPTFPLAPAGSTDEFAELSVASKYTFTRVPEA